MSSRTNSQKVGSGWALFRTIPGRSIFIWVVLFSIFLNALLLVLPFYSIQVFDRVITSGSIETLVGLTVMAVGGLAFYAMFDVVRNRLLSRFAVSFERHVAPLVLEASISEPSRRASGSTHDFVKLRELRTFLSSGTVSTLVDAPFLPLFIIVLYLIHPLYGLIALSGGVMLMTLAVISARIAAAEKQQVQVAARSAQSVLDSIVRHASLVRAMGWTRGAIQEFLRLNDESLSPVVRASERVAAIAAIARFVRMVLQLSAIGVGAWLVLHHEVLPGSMMASSIIIGRTLAPMESLLGAWRALVQAWDGWRQVAVAAELSIDPQRRTLLPPPTGVLEVSGVTHFPAGSRRAVIANVSFRCPAGNVVVIVGPTGAGKSTLLRMIAGLEQPANGMIRLDGAALENWDPDQLGHYVGYLPQDVELMGGTVAAAITGFNDEAGDEDVVEAAMRANAHDMILTLPKGYETDIGRDGTKLSGGQRQRVGLARAFYGERKLVLLDEPNSNLDPEGEEALCEAIKDAKERGQTVVIVTHRPRILTVADWVLILRDGQKVAFGRPNEVMPQATAGATPIRRPEVAASESVRARPVPRVS